MPVRIGKIDLPYVQAIQVAEARMLVEQPILGRAGSAFQDLGRTAVALRLDGLLLGDDALTALEQLRGLEAEAKPVTFAADVTSGLDFTDVIVESIDVAQVAGHRSRYAYTLRVREHVEDPEPPAQSIGGVDAAVDADAAAWAGEAVGAGDVLQDVSTLPAALDANPGILDHLSPDDIAGALSSTGGALSAGGLAGVVDSLGLPGSEVTALLGKVKLEDVVAVYNAVKDPSSIPDLIKNNPGILGRLGAEDLANAVGSKLEALGAGPLVDIVKTVAKDPDKLVGFIENLRNADNLGDFVEKLAGGGIDLLKDLTGVDLGDARALIEGIAGAADFIAAIKDVGSKAGEIVNAVRSFDPIAPIRALTDGVGR